MLIDPSIKYHGIISAIFEIEMYSEKFSYDIIHPTFYLFITKFPLYSNLERGLHELKIVTRGPGQTFSSRLSRVTNRPRVLLTLPAATIVHLIVLRRWRHGQLTSPEATPRANGLYGDVRYSWTETTVSDARSKWNDQRNRERERDYFNGASRRRKVSLVFSGTAPTLSLSLEERRGEEKQVIRFKGFSGSDVNGAWLKCSFWQERGPWTQRLVIRFLRPVRPLEFSTPSVGISRGFRCRSFCLHVFCSKIFCKFSIELKDEIFNIVSDEWTQ